MAVCEMCGKSAPLKMADVEGVELNVCTSCVKYGSAKKRSRVPVFQRRVSYSKEGPSYRVVSHYAALLRKSREAKGMSQQDFAKFLNEKESVVAKWESGALKPRVGVAKRLARTLNLTLLEKEEQTTAEVEKKKKVDSFTLGDFIKVRKRKS